MPPNPKTDIAIVGAGIVGIALAHSAARRGLSVAVFERDQRAVGASIRNFGLIWTIGQPPGALLQRALRSRATWLALAEVAGFGVKRDGSLHLAYHADEQAVLEEFYEQSGQADYQLEWLAPEVISERSPAARQPGLRGGLFSATELTVDPREALVKLPAYLAEQSNVTFHYGRSVTRIEEQRLFVGEDVFEAERVFVSSGSDFETLFPEQFAATEITKCQLQMLRTGPQPAGWQLGPTLCGGLTLRHYAAFEDCASLPHLDARYDEQNPDFKRWGIHVMLAQNGSGELVIGDSHTYGRTLLPFASEKIDNTILDYLDTFAQAPDRRIAERWVGTYAKLPGHTEFVAHPTEHVTIVNALSGAGMTLSFGLAEEVLGGGK